MWKCATDIGLQQKPLLICHGDGIITALSPHHSHSTAEGISAREGPNTSSKPPGRHILILPYPSKVVSGSLLFLHLVRWFVIVAL